MIRMAFTVTYDDGRTAEAVAKPKDIVAFERQYQKSITDFADENNPPPMEWLYYLAWAPLHRTRQEPRAFDEFLDDVAEIEPIGDKETTAEAVPSEPAPSADKSPGSPSEQA